MAESGAAVAALVARARREIQHHFFAKDAVRPDRATRFEPSNAIEKRQFSRMLENGTIRQEGGDRYWLDVVAYDADLRARHRRVRTILILAIVVLAAVAVMPEVKRLLTGL